LSNGSTPPSAFSEKAVETVRDARAFAWSASRHDTFATCMRKYYYSYYGILEDPEVQRLKQLSALALWAGSVVHETIEEFLRTNDAIPDPTVQEALIRSVVHDRMLREWKESEGGIAGFRLFEHEYSQPIEKEDKKILVGIVMRSLRNFFKSPVLREAFRVSRSSWLSMEELISFHVDDVPVFLRMDLAFRDERGRVRIVDWKTGRRAGKFNDVQVAGYALYAAEQGWAKSATEISTELAYLIWPRYVRKDVTQPVLDTARGFVTRSAKTMRALLNAPETNTARMEDFPRVDKPRICRRCNFRKLCFPRADALDVRPRRSSATS
jgi:CRISPR/Cas system-associated exonuclease Cas4 (RecB family)